MSSRPDDYKDGKKHATQLIASRLLKRYLETHPGKTKGEAGQDLQELYKVADGENSSAIGDDWLKLARGARSLGDKELSRVAHLAVLHGQITADDYCTLSLKSGGPRLLQMVGGLLIEAHAGGEFDSDSVMQRAEVWEQARVATNSRRAAELKLLRAKLASTKRRLAAALSAVEALSSAQVSTEFFEVAYRPDGPVAGTFDEEPYAGPSQQLRTQIESLQAAADIGMQILAEARIIERPNHGFADLPTIDAEGSAAEASLKALRQQMFDKLPEAWADDNTGKIRVRGSRIYMRPLPSRKVRVLISVEKRSNRKRKRARQGKQGKLPRSCHVSATQPS